ncbi:MAG: reverse transcriptase/maturase family protein [bacterium]|nr:reverse transcriptase/maturase family protein [bacterium]
MKIQLIHSFNDIISVDNLLSAWQEFVIGKKKKKDVQAFSLRLMDNILQLHQDLANKTYQHGGYLAFNISDPKPRNIHKASVRDRLVHHAIYRILYPFFDKTFIFDSYSCRLDKGTHKAIGRFKFFAGKVNQNNTKTCWVLKGDIKKFFANIDQGILKVILREYIPDQDIFWLLDRIVVSFCANNKPAVGLPLGNLTSQLLVNIYMNQFDQFVKHQLKAKYYIRYADDFVIMADSRPDLENLLVDIQIFLKKKLKLELHPDKVLIKTLSSGVDFLGWVNFFDYRVLRTTTKRRMFKNISQNPNEATVNSYLGLIKNGNTWKIKEDLNKLINPINSPLMLT